MRRAPQFGAPEAGETYPDRPAAFGLAEQEGRIALVRVEKPDAAPWLDLLLPLHAGVGFASLGSRKSMT